MIKKNFMLMGDPHAEPNQSLRRFHLAGRFMVEKNPDVVWCAGDWGSFNSISPHEIGTMYNEGRRYTHDVDACNEALDIFHGYYKKMKKKPLLYMSGGNHEEWIRRVTVNQPHLIGTLTRENVKFEHYGWKVIPFLEPLTLSGICFKHYFTSGTMGRPIGGDNHAMNLLKKGYMSCICGHSHLFDLAETINAAGQKMIGMDVGCFLESKAHYTFEQARWWSGLVMLREVYKGYGSVAKYDFSYLLKHYN